MKNRRILSGIQPSGNLHIGNYFGMMKPMIDLQAENELFCFLPNYHALTSQTDGETLKQNTVEAAADFLSLGMDPEKSVFWVQSDVPEVTELTWVLNNVTSVGMLERATSYKDKVIRGMTAHHGLFSYPVLMTADILLFGTDVVPVGQDQKQHLEMARDIAIKFNSVYGETFVVPKPLITEATGLIPGIDGQKMSKSYSNTLEIFGMKDDLAKRVMSIVTDNTPPEQPKETEKNTLFKIYSLFLDESEQSALEARFHAPGLKYSDIKKELIDVIWEFFALFRKKREGIYNEPETVVKILKDGAEKARAAAQPYLEAVREKTGLIYWQQ
ncbi:MAG: tryptophan--tRNA ligase [Candidatus Neomarinimicrobiota bacterium]|nr:tryptophan--tRNA ligase [Candidatus Neomarinimicrobiota bacterium]